MMPRKICCATTSARTSGFNNLNVLCEVPLQQLARYKGKQAVRGQQAGI